MLQDKHIVLGVCGGIAAYKSALLVRLLVKAGAKVKVIMTDDAMQFITPLTLSTLSKNPVHSQFIADKQTGVWTNHVELGQWADIFIIAPATANTLAKMANGLADNLLTATFLSSTCPIVIAPAMDRDMWQHKATQHNISTLKNFGHTIIDVEEGELASGLEGKGRMAEPETIIEHINLIVKKNDKAQLFKNRKVVVTAGATRESIDPVRFLSNHSTGKMGIAIAKAFARQGADVTLIKGSTTVYSTLQNIQTVHAVSANDMFEHTTKAAQTAEIIVMAAAVADYKPTNRANEKLKKQSDDLTITFTRTIDILAYLGQHKKPGQMLVGFALETENEVEYAKKKLQKKKLDIIVLNSLKDKGAGFAHNTNKITIIDKHNNMRKFELKSKEEVALDILNAISEYENAEILTQ